MTHMEKRNACTIVIPDTLRLIVSVFRPLHRPGRENLPSARYVTAVSVQRSSFAWLVGSAQAAYPEAVACCDSSLFST
jgi:hypothetical protein